MADIYVGRQEIFDRDLNVIGYELLYRSGEVGGAGVIDGNRATSAVVVNTFLEIGIENMVGEGLAFMNFTRDFLLKEGLFSFPREKIVVEVLEDVIPEVHLVSALTRMSRLGYTIALDDFVYREQLDPLIDLADIIKIDVMALEPEQLRWHVERLRRPGLRLLAEKVETRDEFDFCLDLGFDLFQGFFLTRPRVISGQSLPANMAAVLDLLARLQDPDVSVDELEPLIRRDLALSYRLLRYINSARYGLRSEVGSIQQAIGLLGLVNVRNWATVLALAGNNDKPVALMQTTLHRAKMCELLAATPGESARAGYFLAGLFSTLDALLDAQLERILESLPVAAEIRRALLVGEGEIGRALQTVLAYERGDWNAAAAHGGDAARLSSAYLDAARWADETLAAMHEA